MAERIRYYSRYNEQKWYIEVSEGNWQPLSEKYDTSKLWHFENAYINDLY